MILSALMRLRRIAAITVTGPQVIAFTPAVALGAFWTGGEVALLFAALAFPLFYAMMAPGGWVPTEIAPRRDSVTGLALTDALITRLDTQFDPQFGRLPQSACFVVNLKNLDEISDQHGPAAVITVQKAVSERLQASLRPQDLVVCLDAARFGVAPRTARRLDLEDAIQIADRMLNTVQDPITVDSGTLYVGCAIGFCLTGRSPTPTGTSLFDAAVAAAEEASANGPNTIRAYTDGLRSRKNDRGIEAEEAVRALEQGRMVAWYQPQVSTDTGEVSGFETLARWHHPDRGVLTPDKFLPLLESAGALERLGEVMLYQAMTALRHWEAAGHHVPTIGVNFAEAELNNPKLIEKITWELDRFDLEPGRLAVEILENVVTTSPDDNVTRNIAGLARLGCTIDLDDFGTGNASISAIRRFAVNRIKIDRSFVTHLDRDPDQQRMISAILTMAEQLGLETLAEGVETVGEHALLSQLGCDHVQGFGLARPMPFDKTVGWMNEHKAKLNESTPRIGRNTG